MGVARGEYLQGRESVGDAASYIVMGVELDASRFLDLSPYCTDHGVDL